MRKTVILHIGLPKTGTSFIQHTFHANKEYLAGKQILYPVIGSDSCFADPGHHLLAFDLFKYRRQDVADCYADALVGNIWARVTDEIIASDCEVAFLSSEVFALHNCYAEEIQRIRAELEQFDVHLVVALRDINDFIESFYRQNIHTGFVGSIEDLAAEHWDNLDWRRLVNFWTENLLPKKLHILEYNEQTKCNWLEYVVSNIFPGRFSCDDLVQAHINTASISYELALYILELNKSGVINDNSFVNDVVEFVRSRNVKTEKSDVFLSKNLSVILAKHCKWPEKSENEWV